MSNATSHVAADLGDLRALIETDGPFFTVAVPTPSRLDDAAHRFETNWNRVRGMLSERWTDDDFDPVDDAVRQLPHDGGEALVVVRARGGPTHLEFLAEPVHELTVAEGAAPRLGVIIEARQRTVPHIVVDTDRAGADITAFDGGVVLATELVEGETEHIHRGHPGGWSQRRFQQRAENTWEHNAGEVADAASALARRVDAVKIFVVGEVRAQSLVTDAISADLADRVVKVAAGSPGGVADEVVRLLADHVASGIRDLAERLKSRLGTGTASIDVDETLDAAAAGRVEVLMVHDDGADGPVLPSPIGGLPAGTRVVDAAIRAGLRSDAQIVVVPGLAVMNGPVACLLRW